MEERVLRIARKVLSELDVDRVLTAALDGLIDLCGAERGMILLFDPAGELLFEKARNLERQDVEHPEFQVSRTVIRQVRTRGEAFFDPYLPAHPTGRFSDSVHRLQLMAVICLPLEREGKVFGVAYLDTRNRRHLFTDETLDLARGVCENIIAAAAHNALERYSLRSRVDCLEKELREKYHFETIVGQDPAMLEVLKLVAQVAASDATVLVEGESGTGKELVARALHYNSSRADRPFVPVNCGALPESLQEAELFGHEKGAYTGAFKSNPGWFERADGGTIFLDEVGEMQPSLQVKLLRVLESGEHARVGSTTLRQVDVRIVAATNRNLEELVREGKMRQDLHYRLAVIRVRLPPLRERRSDISLLIRHFLDRLAAEMNGRKLRLSPAAEAALKAYDYPGNVRELQNFLQGAVLMAEGSTIDLQHLPAALAGAGTPAVTVPPGDLSFREAKQRVIDSFERDYIARCLDHSGGNITQAAKLAGIDVKNFHTKMTKRGVDPAVFKGRK